MLVRLRRRLLSLRGRIGQGRTEQDSRGEEDVKPEEAAIGACGGVGRVPNVIFIVGCAEGCV